MGAQRIGLRRRLRFRLQKRIAKHIERGDAVDSARTDNRAERARMSLFEGRPMKSLADGLPKSLDKSTPIGVRTKRRTGLSATSSLTTTEANGSALPMVRWLPPALVR
jgi:hypothetical protein